MDFTRLFIISLTFIIICITSVFCIHNYEEYFGDKTDKNNLVFNLKRQKTPRHQLLNAADYGVPSDIIEKKKPKPPTPPRTNDSVALYRYLDNEFYTEVIYGHPGQKMNVALDTTWVVTWVMSVKCDSFKIHGCWFHNKYDHKKSSMYIPDGTPYILNEGTFNFTGNYAYENISGIGHSNVTHQSFVEMDFVGSSFVFSKADGVIGLALKVGDYDPVFYTLRKQKKIKNSIFSIYLNRDRQSKHGGNVMLGFIEPRHIHNNNGTLEPITTIPVDPSLSYWQFSVDKIIFQEDKQALILCPTGCKALPDSSSNIIIGPKDDIKRINNAIEAREFAMGYYVVNCETINKLPPITFVIAGKNHTLVYRDYIMRMTYRSMTLCASAFQEASESFEEDRWILGGAFMAAYYTIYHTDTKEIGIVKAAP